MKLNHLSNIFHAILNDSIMCNSNQKWNNDKYQCEYKKYCTCEKIIV